MPYSEAASVIDAGTYILTYVQAGWKDNTCIIDTVWMYGDVTENQIEARSMMAESRKKSNRKSMIFIEFAFSSLTWWMEWNDNDTLKKQADKQWAKKKKKAMTMTDKMKERKERNFIFF